MPGSEAPARSAVRLVLASASPARLATLRAAGIEPEVVVSGVDESLVDEEAPPELALRLAELKGRAVAARLSVRTHQQRVLVLACDSVLDVGGTAFGKPSSPDEARERLRGLSGRTAVLHTGHHLTNLSVDPGPRSEIGEVASTVVRFAELDDEEIAAYVATGEPLHVAGAFTIDGLGGAFVEGVDGDPHNVVGLSLPLLRSMVRRLGISWPDLWTRDET